MAAHKCLVKMHSRATSLTRALRAGSWMFRSLRLLKLHHGSVTMAPQLRYHDNRRKSLSRLVPGTNQASLQVDLGVRSVRDHGSTTMTPRLRYHGSAPLRLNARRAFRKRRCATRRCRERRRCEETTLITVNLFTKHLRSANVPERADRSAQNVGVSQKGR